MSAQSFKTLFLSLSLFSFYSLPNSAFAVAKFVGMKAPKGAGGKVAVSTADVKKPGGFLMVIIGPSGVGKDVGVNAFRVKHPEVRKVVSLTTRGMRFNEKEGLDYKFVSMETFNRFEKKGELLESESVHGNKYGILKSDVEKLAALKQDIVINVNPKGAKHLRSVLREIGINTINICMLPPSLATIRQRLEARGTESPKAIGRRMKDFVHYYDEYQMCDYAIVSSTIPQLANDLAAIYAAEFLKRETKLNIDDMVSGLRAQYKEMIEVDTSTSNVSSK